MEANARKILLWGLVACIAFMVVALVVDDARFALPYLLVAVPGCVVARVFLGTSRTAEWLSGTDWKDLWPQGIAIGIGLAIVATAIFVLSNA